MRAKIHVLKTKGAEMKTTSLERFKEMTPQELGAQTTRALVAALEGSRGQATCDCGSVGCDDGMSESEKAFNLSQDKLGVDCKAILATREHLARDTRQVAKKEKKAMAY
jgi:hypothetical protein